MLFRFLRAAGTPIALALFLKHALCLKESGTLGAMASCNGVYRQKTVEKESTDRRSWQKGNNELRSDNEGGLCRLAANPTHIFIHSFFHR